ncbi:MAG: hypothetical protein JST22_01600 [Bacteroidetes bacterium]|nr:hypothetical protein [Bacteroidota bacterium]
MNRLKTTGTLHRMLLAVLLGAMALSATVARAQPQAKVRIYHGAGGASQIITYDTGDGPHQTTLDRLMLILEPGTEVEVVIENANTPFYDYANDISEKPAPAAPDLGGLLGVLKGLPGLPVVPSSSADTVHKKKGGALLSEGTPFPAYLHAIDTLRQSLNEAREIVEHSDVPEPLGDVGNANGGLRGAQKALRGLPSGPYQFNSDNLKEEMQKAYDAAKAGQQDVLMEALRAYVGTLLAARDAIRQNVLQAAPTVTLKLTVPANGVDVKVTAKAKDTNTARARDAGKLVALDIQTRQTRPPFDMQPVAFLLYRPDIVRFVEKNGVVARDTVGDLSAGAAGVLRYNFTSWGRRGEWYCSAMLGAGVDPNGGTQPVNLFGGLMLSNGTFSIGLAGGWAWIPTGLEAPAVEGAALPSGSKPLEDLVQTRPRGCLYLTFSLPGLNIPLPF